jgi:hypothetical protein
MGARSNVRLVLRLVGVDRVRSLVIILGRVIFVRVIEVGVITCGSRGRRMPRLSRFHQDEAGWAREYRKEDVTLG